MNSTYLDISDHQMIVRLSIDYEIEKIMQFLEEALNLSNQPPKTLSLELDGLATKDFQTLCQQLIAWHKQNKLSLENILLYVPSLHDEDTAAQKNGTALAEFIKLDSLQKISFSGECTSSEELQNFFKPLMVELQQRKQHPLKEFYIYSQNFGVSPYSVMAEVIKTGAIDKAVLDGMHFFGRDNAGLEQVAEAILATPECQVQADPNFSPDCKTLEKILEQKKTEKSILKQAPKKMLLSDEVKKITREPVVKEQKPVVQVTPSLTSKA